MKYLLLFVISIVVDEVIAQNVALSLNLEKGKEYTQSFQSKMTISHDISGEKIEVTATVQLTMTFLVRAINSSGYDMDVTFEKLGYAIEGVSADVSYSSDKNDPEDLMSTFLKAMMGKPLDVTIARNGEVVQIGENDRVWESIIGQFKEISEEKVSRQKSSSLRRLVKIVCWKPLRQAWPSFPTSH
jgi:hypothetical protein